jgi:glycosyl transferase family 25
LNFFKQLHCSCYIMAKKLKILNEYFDKIFVITLQRSTDRHEKINRHFSDVEFEYFYGVDKLNLTMEELVRTNVYSPSRARKMHRNNKEMFLGQVACSLSHKQLYKHILDKGYEKVLIMEDDFVPAVTDEIILDQIIKELPANWELVYWGYYHNEKVSLKMKFARLYYYFMSSLRMIKWTAKQVSGIYPRKYSTHLKKAGFHNTTHAYAVSRPILQKLVQLQTPVAFCADTLLTELVLSGDTNAFITIPKVFDQEIFTEGGSKVSYISS